MIIKGKCYTNNRTDLAAKVLSIYFVNDEYVKCKLMVFNKKNGTVYEPSKSYRLVPSRIADWEEFDLDHLL